jgi:phosphonatase-like hydrolase
VNDLFDIAGLWPGSAQESVRPDVVVFDLECTALADANLVPRYLRAALSRAGISATIDEIHQLMGAAVRDVLTELVARHRGPTLADARRTAFAVEEDFSRRLCEFIESAPEMRPMPGADHAFAALQTDGVRVAVDSSLSSRVAGVILDRLGWLRSGLVDVVVTSDRVMAGRPAPDMIREAVRQAQSSGGTVRIAKVGSTPADLAAAAAAGCQWLLAFPAGPFGTAALQAQRPTHLISSLGEVSEVLISQILV